MDRVHGFQLWRHTPDAVILPVGQLAIRQADNGRLSRIQFRYLQDYLSMSGAIPLDPENAPLKEGVISFDSDGHHVPGFISDALPDAWGQRVLATVLKRKYLDTVTLLTHAGTNVTGDLAIQPYDSDQPKWSRSIPLQDITDFVNTGWTGDLEFSLENIEYISMLKQGGSGAGGARPKLLVNDAGQEWLYKFNRSSDPFDVAEAEYRCLSFARAAGIDTPGSEMLQVGDRGCLRVKRFDVSPAGGRYRLLTLNSLLKNSHTQADPDYASYRDIANIIKKYSIEPEADIQQLFGQMLVNGITRNTDDHLRNFSLIHRGDGWRLSPAYDIVPSFDNDPFHQLDMLNGPTFPGIDKARELARHIGLPAALSKDVIERVIDSAEDYGFDPRLGRNHALRP